MSLQNISNVSISLDGAGITRQGFGTTMFLAPHNFSTTRVLTFSNLSEVAEVFALDSAPYKAANSLFQNEPSTNIFKVGRVIGSTNIAPDVLDASNVLIVGKAVSLTVTDTDGGTVTATYTTQGGDTVADVVTDLVADINAVLGSTGTGTVTLTNNGDDFDIVATAQATTDFYISDVTNAFTSETATESYLAAYTACGQFDNDWWGLTMQSSAWADVEGVADAVEAADPAKFMVVGTSNTDAYTTAITSSPTDVAYQILNKGYNKVTSWFSQDRDDDYNELEFFGYNLPFPAGSVTWANIRVGVAAAQHADGSLLTSTEQKNLQDRNCNYMAQRGNIRYNVGGKVGSGEWIDVIRGRDNLVADIQADMFDLLTNQQGTKINYDNKGIQTVGGVLENRLNYYETARNFITDIAISLPKSSDVPTNDKSSRVLNDVSFSATLLGAIHITNITGRLSV